MASATGEYVTTTLLKERLDPNTDYTWTAAEDTLLDKIVEETNQWVETYTETVLAPFSYTNALFDGWPAPKGNVGDHGRALKLPRGIRAVTTLEVADGTGDSFTTIAAGDVFLRPGEFDRSPYRPATHIFLSDSPTGSYRTFPVGYANIRLTGTGGPAAVPDDVRMVAVTVAERCWLASKGGRADGVQTIEADGSVTVTRYVAAEDKRTLDRYRLREMV